MCGTRRTCPASPSAIAIAPEHQRRDPGADERGGDDARAPGQLGVDGRLQRDQRTHTDGREHGEQAGHGAPFRGRDAYPPASVMTDSRDLSRLPGHAARRRRRPRTRDARADDLGEGEVTVRVRLVEHQLQGRAGHDPQGPGGAHLPARAGRRPRRRGRGLRRAPPCAVGDEVLVTGYDLGVAHHGGWAEYARVPAAWVVALPDGLSPRQAMALGTAGLTAGLSIHALEAHGLRPDRRAGARARRQRRRREHRGRRAGRRRLRGLGGDGQARPGATTCAASARTRSSPARRRPPSPTGRWRRRAGPRRSTRSAAPPPPTPCARRATAAPSRSAA